MSRSLPESRMVQIPFQIPLKLKQKSFPPACRTFFFHIMDHHGTSFQLGAIFGCCFVFIRGYRHFLPEKCSMFFCVFRTKKSGTAGQAIPLEESLKRFYLETILTVSRAIINSSFVGMTTTLTGLSAAEMIPFLPKQSMLAASSSLTPRAATASMMRLRM